MPAPAELRPRERAIALAAVAVVQLALGLVLLGGFRVDLSHPAEVAQRLIQVTLAKPPPPVPPPQPRHALHCDPFERRARARPADLPADPAALSLPAEHGPLRPPNPRRG